jgi:hypothetical protein
LVQLELAATRVSVERDAVSITTLEE